MEVPERCSNCKDYRSIHFVSDWSLACSGVFIDDDRTPFIRLCLQRDTITAVDGLKGELFGPFDFNCKETEHLIALLQDSLKNQLKIERDLQHS